MRHARKPVDEAWHGGETPLERMRKVSDLEEVDAVPAHLSVAKAAQARCARRLLDRATIKRSGCLYCAKCVRVTHRYLAFVEAACFKAERFGACAALYFCTHGKCPYSEANAIKEDYLAEYDKRVAGDCSTIGGALKNIGFKQPRKSAQKKRRVA